jgi:hypothetical protein
MAYHIGTILGSMALRLMNIGPKDGWLRPIISKPRKEIQMRRCPKCGRDSVICSWKNKAGKYLRCTYDFCAYAWFERAT